MWRNFRIKLVGIMVLFAAVIAFTIAIINHIRLTDQAVQHNEFQVVQIEATIAHSLNSIDKAYHYFDEDLAERMRTSTRGLISHYHENKQVETWDIDALKEEIGMDIYLIDLDNVIVASSVQSDVGMDFNACCGKLAKILDERRETGEFYHDGMDLAQASGEVTKFSYMATPDKEYIIELGYSLEEGEIFQDFNFLRVMRDLEGTYPSINEINILNIGGLALGSEADESTLSPKRREAFEKTLHQEETNEIRIQEDEEQLTYRYVPYDAVYDFGSTQNKVIEIAYNERELEASLTEHRNSFLLQLTFILLITVLIAFIISKWVARPMYMAFHDNLTGLRNRAAFDEDVQKALDEQEGLISLLMIDLDHFKMVNDLYGHMEGDRLLNEMANTIQSTLHPRIKAYRLGGDEFAILLKNTTYEEAIETAERVLEKLNENVLEQGNYKQVKMTASIGIAFATDKMVDVKELYHQADQALYGSKKDGKNQYKVFG